MPDIKTRDVIKGTVKVIDKSAVAAERMKDAYVRTKDKAEHGVFAAESSPEEYAADRTLTGTETAAHEAAHGSDFFFVVFFFHCYLPNYIFHFVLIYNFTDSILTYF